MKTLHYALEQWRIAQQNVKAAEEVVAFYFKEIKAGLCVGCEIVTVDQRRGRVTELDLPNLRVIADIGGTLYKVNLADLRSIEQPLKWSTLSEAQQLALRRCEIQEQQNLFLSEEALDRRTLKGLLARGLIRQSSFRGRAVVKLTEKALPLLKG